MAMLPVIPLRGQEARRRLVFPCSAEGLRLDVAPGLEKHRAPEAIEPARQRLAAQNLVRHGNYSCASL